MFPIQMVDDIANHRLFNMKHFGKFNLVHVPRILPIHFSDFRDIGFRQFVHSMRDAFGLSVLKSFISVIVAFCSKKKMVGIYACAIVASVKNADSIRYFSKSQLPCKPMGLNAFSFALNDAVSIGIFGPCPIPARFSFVSIRPKPSFWIPKAWAAISKFLLWSWCFTVFANAVEILFRHKPIIQKELVYG